MTKYVPLSFCNQENSESTTGIERRSCGFDRLRRIVLLETIFPENTAKDIKCHSGGVILEFRISLLRLKEVQYEQYKAGKNV